MKKATWLDKVKNIFKRDDSVELSKKKPELEQIKEKLLELNPLITGSDEEFEGLIYKFPELKNDKSFVLKAVSQFPLVLLPYLNLELRDDKEVIWNAIVANPYAFEFASDRLKNDIDFVTKAIGERGELFEYDDEFRNIGVAFQYASQNLRDNKELAIMAVKVNGENLRFASKRLRDDKDVVMAAITSMSAVESIPDLYDRALNSEPLKYASPRLQNNKNIKAYFELFKAIQKALLKEDDLLFRISYARVRKLEQKLAKLDVVGEKQQSPSVLAQIREYQAEDKATPKQAQTKQKTKEMEL